jgi:anti-sigma regulatory factor (Ser/Thr protein kinase)
MEVQRRYPPDVASAHRAQEFVAQFLGGAPFDTEVARVITCELVTNAVVHGHSDVTITVSTTFDRRVRLEVRDGSSECDLHAECPPPEATSGRGLFFVETLASSWGVEPQPDGKTVWALLDPPALKSSD